VQLAHTLKPEDAVYFPASQLKQAVDPVDAANEPGSQLAQLEFVEAMLAEYIPVAQLVQEAEAELDWKVPAAQFEQIDDDEAE